MAEKKITLSAEEFLAKLKKNAQKAKEAMKERRDGKADKQ